MNSILPTPLIVLFTILLVIRAIRHQQSLYRCVNWKKYRRMIIQLLSISGLFLLFNLPMTSLVLAQVFGLPIGASGQSGDCTIFSIDLFLYYCRLSALLHCRKFRRKSKQNSELDNG
jgi:hypothetical protein